MPGSPPRLRLFPAAVRYWTGIASSAGPLSASRALVAALWDFARESTPSRLRQRYGDADYDWDHRVNTTSAAVGWRDRLLGAFHSPYQPTEPALFHAMLHDFEQQAGVDFGDYTFLDLGSGKGRTLLMASDYPFRRIIGVELLAALDQIAQDNLRHYQSESQRCFRLESICADATRFSLPDGPLLIYLFNPFNESDLRRFLNNLDECSRGPARPLFLVYHNPLLEHVLGERGFVRKVGGTHQYSMIRVLPRGTMAQEGRGLRA